MMPSSDVKHELCEILWRIGDGSSTSDDVDRLEWLIGEDPTLHTFAARFAAMYGMLHWDRGFAAPCDRRQDAAAMPTARISPTNPREEVLPGMAVQAASGWFASGWPVAYLVATVIFAIGLAAGALVRVSAPTGVDVVQSPTLIPAPVLTDSSAVARITGMVDCELEDSGVRGRGSATAEQESDVINRKSPIHLGDRLALKSGLMEITYDSGAKVILQGPVTYEAESRTGGYLSFGKLTARLEKTSLPSPASGRGAGGEDALNASTATNSRPPNQKSQIANHKSFSVRTPTALITDLGTEFGVEVGAEGVTSTEVFAGSVTVQPSKSNDELPPQIRALTAGQFARVSTDFRLTMGKTDLGELPRFQRALRKKTDAADAYAQLVLSMKPVVYYRMEWPQDGENQKTVQDSSGNQCHGKLYLGDGNGATPWWPGHFGSALYLRGPSVGDYAIVPDYPKAENNELSLSVWVNADTRSPLWSLIAANWGMDVHGQFHFGLEAEGDLTIEITPRDKKKVLVREGRDHPLPTGQWQHVAFVVDRATVHLYRNGVEVASGPCLGVLPNTPLSHLIIGNKNNDVGGVLTDPPLHWHGRIDELAIFNKSLTIEQIRKLRKESGLKMKSK